MQDNELDAAFALASLQSIFLRKYGKNQPGSRLPTHSGVRIPYAPTRGLGRVQGYRISHGGYLKGYYRYYADAVKRAKKIHGEVIALTAKGEQYRVWPRLR